MNTYIIGDIREDFISDINTSMMLEGYSFQLYTASDFDDVRKLTSQYKNAVVVLSENIVEDADIDTLPVKPYGYATTPKGKTVFQSIGVSCIGLCRTSAELLEALETKELKNVPRKNTPTQNASTAQNSKKASNNQSTKKQPAQRQHQPKAESSESTPSPAQTPAQANPQMPQGQFSQEMMMQMMQMMQQMGMTPQQNTNVSSAASGNQNPEMDDDIDESADDAIDDSEEDDVAEEPARPQKKLPKQKTTGTKMREKKQKRQNKTTDEQIDSDLLDTAIAKKHETSIITVYAAKGGVGKTSISTELAVCLALTSNGRRKFRVCICDYNIDFGDVATTLELDDSGPNMSYWASEIREMIERGQNPDEITFTKHQMEDYYLQQMKDTGLYALCAPLTHEDSMSVSPDELSVMLRNLKENGDFDFIICDTGNNTRDSSIIAIDMSDYVLLVATQDVTTANCNASVIRTLSDAGFDTDKIRLIVNNAMSSRETGISVQEVEETFPYKCICRIKHTPDIIRANNLSRPLVYKPKHEYTKQIQRIVRFVTAGEIPEEPKKKGFFGFRKDK